MLHHRLLGYKKFKNLYFFIKKLLIKKKVTPSKLSVSKYTYDSNFSLFNFSAIDEESIVFEPTSDLDNYGTEDPRIAYRQVDQTYYMFYTAAQ